MFLYYSINIYGSNMKKLRNKKGERLILDVSGRKAVLHSKEGTISYTAFIDFDKSVDYQKITKIRLV